MTKHLTSRSAKDFLVSRIADEAERQGTPLSETERKTLYWAETDSSGPEAVEASDQFDREYDSKEYESRIAKLLKQAYKRDKIESPDAKHQWQEAIRVLQKEDHYLMVMVDQSIGRVRPKGDLLKLWLTALVVMPVFTGLIWLIMWAQDRFQPSKTEQVVIFASFVLLFWLASKSAVVSRIIDRILDRVDPIEGYRHGEK